MSDRAGTHVNGVAGGDASALVAATAQGAPPIALFYADEALLAHVESALAEAGVPVACKMQIDKVDHASLVASSAAIALINLDDLCDDKFDALSVMLDAAGIPTVFNDAIISRGLDGWAHARWARHLIAKLRGSVDVDPPRPAPAVQMAGAQDLVDTHDQTAVAIELAGDTDASVPAAARPLTQNEIESLRADFPSDSGDASRDAEALSAHVDVLLANAADGAASGLATWEVAAVPESSAPMHQETASPFAAVASGPDAWQLVDESNVFSAPHEAAPVAASVVAQTDDLDFELEPIEHAMPALVREREFEEMRVEEVKSARRPGKNAKSTKRADKVK